MQSILRTMAFHGLAAGKAFPTTMTEKSDLQKLLRSLHPRMLPKPLVRLGPKGDGGYLVPDDLDHLEACFSPGVNDVSGFEKDCADRGMRVFLADKSVERPAESHALFHFTKKYVGVTSNQDFMTIDDWVAGSLPKSSGDLLLQIDIEGWEYENFLAMSDALMCRFRIIVGEFHNLNQLWNQPYFGLVSRAFEKILQTHTCVHIHPNNFHPPFEMWDLSLPPLAEFTFVRKDRGISDSSDWARQFPHPLDGDNSTTAHYPLPKCWYRA